MVSAGTLPVGTVSVEAGAILAEKEAGTVAGGEGRDWVPAL